jgi:predicted DNA-binding protein
MAATSKHPRAREQISIPLPLALRERLQQAAEREHRTIASLARHLLAGALDQQQRRDGATA